MKKSKMRERELKIAELSLLDDNIKRKLLDLFDFFRKYSLIDRFDHERVVRSLFDCKNVMTLTSICREVHIDDKTLYRYRKMYLMIYDAINDEA